MPVSRAMQEQLPRRGAAEIKERLLMIFSVPPRLCGYLVFSLDKFLSIKE